MIEKFESTKRITYMFKQGLDTKSSTNKGRINKQGIYTQINYWRVFRFNFLSLAFNAINTELLFLNDLENQIRLKILDNTA